VVAIMGVTLSAATVLAIYQSQDVQKRIAARYGVSIGTVSMIKAGRRRADVTLRHLAGEYVAERVRAESAALVTAAFCPELGVT
jgi:transcriptional regulator with XRE-family HTH domain